jgi:hypothetical protein
MVLQAHKLQAVQDTLMSVSSEGKFTPEAETVFPTYLPQHYSGVTE